MKKIIKIFTGLVWTILVAFFLLIAATFLPIPGNYKVYTVQSGSMEPKISVGSLIFVKSSKSYGVGDIVTFRAQDGKNTVTHRIIEKKEVSGGTAFLTKGDANEDPDPEEIKESSIIGKTLFSLPLVGYPIAYAKTKIGFILLILIPSTIIIYEELRKMGLEIKSRFEMRRSKIRKEADRKESMVHTDNIGAINIENDMADPPIYRRPPLEKRLPRRKIV